MKLDMLKKFLIDWSQELQKIATLKDHPSSAVPHRLFHIARYLPTYFTLEKDFLSMELQSGWINETQEEQVTDMIHSCLSKMDQEESLDKLNGIKQKNRFIQARLSTLEEMFPLLTHALQEFQNATVSPSPSDDIYNPFLSELENYITAIKNQISTSHFDNARHLLETADSLYRTKKKEWKAIEFNLLRSIKSSHQEIQRNYNLIEALQKEQVNTKIFYMQLMTEHYMKKATQNWLSLAQNILSHLGQYKASLITLNGMLRKPQFHTPYRTEISQDQPLYPPIAQKDVSIQT